MVSLQTPAPLWNLNANPFNDEPRTPRASSRVALEITKRVSDNIDTLSAPSFSEPQQKRYKLNSSYNSQSPLSSPLFNAALQRMRQGDALRKLKEQRYADADNRKGEEAMKHLRAVTTAASPAEKSSPTSTQVKLGRQLPERRRSEPARSA
jgi:hypothetical protein